MVEIQLYLAKIGIFTMKHYFKSKCSPRALRSNNRFREDSNFLFITFFPIMVCFYLLITVSVANLEAFNNFKTTALKLSGDADFIPGPYEIIKSVHSSFSQSNVVLFGETVGRQCACNGLFSICWSVI